MACHSQKCWFCRIQKNIKNFRPIYIGEGKFDREGLCDDCFDEAVKEIERRKAVLRESVRQELLKGNPDDWAARCGTHEFPLLMRHRNRKIIKEEPN